MSATANNSKKSMSKVPGCMTPSFNPLELTAGVGSNPSATPEYTSQWRIFETGSWHTVAQGSL